MGQMATFDDDVSWGGEGGVRVRVRVRVRVGEGGAFEFITSPMITVLKSAYGQ